MLTAHLFVIAQKDLLVRGQWKKCVKYNTSFLSCGVGLFRELILKEVSACYGLSRLQALGVITEVLP